MAYLPLSQIKSNLYTKGGEFVIESTQEDYRGYYYETSKGEYFSGKTPQDTPSVKIIKIFEETIDIDSPIIQPTKPSFWTISDPKYQKDLSSPPTSPISTYPKVTEKQYQLGEFQRYFLSKTNEIKFIEVNQITYDKYLNKDSDVAYQLYLPINISWTLTGNREDVYKINYNTVTLAQKRLNLVGFVQYFQNRFTQFYKESGE